MDDKSCSEVKFHKPISSIGNLVFRRELIHMARRAVPLSYNILHRDSYPRRRLKPQLLMCSKARQNGKVTGFTCRNQGDTYKPRHPLQSGQPEELIKGRGKMPIRPNQKRQLTLYRSECTVRIRLKVDTR